MYIRPEQILEQYEVEVKAISKGRDCFLCETDSGMMALKVYRGSEERAAFLEGMLDFLEKKGILVEKIQKTKEEKILAEDEEEQKYLLETAFRGAECDTKSAADMLHAVRLLARLHIVSKEYGEAVPEFIKTDGGTLIHLYEKHNRELKMVRNYMKSKKKKSRFEEIFSKEYDSFRQKAIVVTDILKELEPDEKMFGFCHGDFNQHNLIFTKEGTALINFENYGWQMQTVDLANFMRKMLEKNNWSIDLGFKLLWTYEEEKKLSAEERKYLYCYLAYPEKFWKIANRYSQCHKAWLSERNTEKLQKVIMQENAREQFLCALSQILLENAVKQG